jgi:hypothetical protein
MIDRSGTAAARPPPLSAGHFHEESTHVHHAIPLNGTSRSVQDWRNHFAFLKALPKEQHRRLTGSWAGKPMYDPIRRAWYGSTDWMKAAPTGVAGYAADAWENVTHPFSAPGPATKPGP